MRPLRSHKIAFATIFSVITPAITNLFKLPLVDGVSHHAKATFSSLALRAVVTDTKERRTAPGDVALPVLFVREQFQTEGFEPFYKHTYLFQMSCLFIFLFYASRHAVNDLGLEIAE